MKVPELSKEEESRYSRHILLRDVGIDGQMRLKSAKVLCVGTGGLGSPISIYLTAAGVGTIGLIDFDTVEESNLQRQIVHSSASIGQLKTTSAQKRLNELNPLINITTHCEALRTDNAIAIIKEYDIVIDGTDNFPTRYLINDACELLGKPFIYGSIFQFEGQVSLFNAKGGWQLDSEDKWIYENEIDGPTYRDLYPEPPSANSIPSCSEAGVFGVLPGVIGCIQATEAIKYILGIGAGLSGRILTYNALSMKFREFKLRKDLYRKPVTELINYREFCGFPKDTAYTSIDLEELLNRRNTGWKPFVLDVRSLSESVKQSFPFVNLQHPHDHIEEIISKLPTDQDILVHCQRGGRSAQVCAKLHDLGFSKVINLSGGIEEWRKT